jgi:hypothetical protein
MAADRAIIDIVAKVTPFKVRVIPFGPCISAADQQKSALSYVQQATHSESSTTSGCISVLLAKITFCGVANRHHAQKWVELNICLEGRCLL